MVNPVGGSTNSNEPLAQASSEKLVDATQTLEKQLNQQVASSSSQRNWIKSTLMREMSSQIQTLKKQAISTLDDKTQLAKALEMLGKLEKNLDRLTTPPPENWEGFLTGFFRDFEKDFVKIFSAKNHPFLSYAVSKLGATASNSYIEFIKGSLTQNEVFKNRPEEVRNRLVKRYVSEIKNKAFSIAMPKLGQNNPELQAATSMMKISLLTLPSWFTFLHTRAAHAEPQEHEVSAQAAEGGSSEGAQLDPTTSAALGAESVEVSKKAWRAKFPVSVKTKRTFPKHQLIFDDLKQVEKRTRDIQAAIKTGIKNRTITKDQIDFYKQELSTLELNREALSTPTHKMTRTTVQSLTTLYKILITVELLHILEMQTKGATSLEVLDENSVEFFSTIFENLERVDHEFSRMDLSDEPLLEEFGDQLEENMSQLLAGLKSVSRKVEPIKISPHELLALAVDLVPIAHALGLGVITGLHAINIKSLHKKRKAELKKRGRIERGNCMVQTVLSKRTVMKENLDLACQETLVKHPSVKIDKSEKKELETRFKELENRYVKLDKKLMKARTDVERFAVIAEIQDVNRESRAFFEQMAKFTEPDYGSIEKRKERVHKAKELQLIALRKMEFWKSKETLIFGYQQCIANYLAATESEHKTAIPLSSENDAATQIYQGIESPVSSPSKHTYSAQSAASKVAKVATKAISKVKNVVKNNAEEMRLRPAVEARLEGVDALKKGKATNHFYENLLQWNLSDLGLSDEHITAISDFIQYRETNPSLDPLNEQLESTLIGILENKHKSAEKSLSYTTDTLLRAVNYGAFNAAQFGVVTAAAAGALGNPLTAPVLAGLGLVCAGAYQVAKVKQAKLPETLPEQMRQEDIFISALNLLTNSELLSNIPEEALSETSKDSLKEALLILAGISQEEQDEMCVRAAFAVDQLTVGQVNGGLEELRKIK